MSQDFLQQRLFERLPGAAPQTLLPSGLRDHHPAQSALRRRPGEDEAHRVGCDHAGKETTHLMRTSKGSRNTPEVVVGELLQRVGFSFILLVRKGYVGQTDGFSPLIRSHGHESLRGRRRGKEEREGGVETKSIHGYFSV